MLRNLWQTLKDWFNHQIDLWIDSKPSKKFEKYSDIETSLDVYSDLRYNPKSIETEVYVPYGSICGSGKGVLECDCRICDGWRQWANESLKEGENNE